MKILFYGTRDYDQIFFDRLKPEYPDIEFTFLESNLYKETASLAAGYDGICAFVNADLGAEVIEEDLWVKPGDHVRGFEGANDAIGTLVLKFNSENKMRLGLSDLHKWLTIKIDRVNV